MRDKYNYRAANNRAQAAASDPFPASWEAVATLSIPRRPLRNAPLALAGASEAARACPATNALATITVASIPIHCSGVHSNWMV